MLRFDLSRAIDPLTVTTHDTRGTPAVAQVFFSAGNDFGPGRATRLNLYSCTVALQPGADELLLFPDAPSTRAAPTPLVGVDFEGSNQTKLGSPTIRTATCSWNTTWLMCAGESEFTVWRMGR